MLACATDIERFARRVVADHRPVRSTLTRSVIAVTTSATIGLLAGCVGGPELHMPLVAQPGEHVQIIWLHAYPDKKGVLLMGHVRRQGVADGPLWGHLHVVAQFADEAEPLIVDTRWLGSLSQRGNRMAPFAAILGTTQPNKIARVSVEYRAGPDE